MLLSSFSSFCLPSLTSCSSLSSFSASLSTFLPPTYSSSHSFFTLSFYCKHILLLQWEVNALGMSKCVTSELKSSHLKILTESRKLILSELITVYFFEHSQDYFCEHIFFCSFAIQMVMLVNLWGWCIKIGWLSALVSLNHFHLIYYVGNREIEI